MSTPSKYRLIYNQYELDLLSQKLSDSLHQIVDDYSKTFTMDDVVFGDAIPRTFLLKDILETELENSVELSQVVGVTPKEAFARAYKGLYNGYDLYVKSETKKLAKKNG